MPYWRSPVAAVSDMSGVAHRFGVALSLLGTEDDMRVRALGVTILPTGPFSKVLQMIFTPPAQPLSLLCNEDNSAFYSIQIGTSMIAFEPSVLTLTDIASINPMCLSFCMHAYACAHAYLYICPYNLHVHMQVFTLSDMALINKAAHGQPGDRGDARVAEQAYRRCRGGERGLQGGDESRRERRRRAGR